MGGERFLEKMGPQVQETVLPDRDVNDTRVMTGWFGVP
jgi:hypothetical protein